MQGRREPIEKRFWEKVKKTKGCWLWTAVLTSRGYGQIGWDGKSVLAHRVSYELYNGPIPKGLYVCHSCDNPKCVRPDHLFLGTQKDNIGDASRKGRVQHGDRGSNSKLTESDVRRIRLFGDAYLQKN